MQLLSVVILVASIRLVFITQSFTSMAPPPPHTHTYHHRHHFSDSLFTSSLTCSFFPLPVCPLPLPANFTNSRQFLSVSPFSLPVYEHRNLQIDMPYEPPNC